MKQPKSVITPCLEAVDETDLVSARPTYGKERLPWFEEIFEE